MGETPLRLVGRPSLRHAVPLVPPYFPAGPTLLLAASDVRAFFRRDLFRRKESQLLSRFLQSRTHLFHHTRLLDQRFGRNVLADSSRHLLVQAFDLDDYF